ncbi:MAG TPA: zinc ribbon domain-containing protein [Ktedonobacteraceae bacterium]|nr:zinc ribbon domain-containing protein [Ktedonobacteraceae bacterium]
MSSTATCPNCKRPLPPAAAACPHCGTALRPQSQQSPMFVERLTQALPDVVKQLDSPASTNMTIAGVLIGFYAGAIFAGKVAASIAFNPLSMLCRSAPCSQLSSLH